MNIVSGIILSCIQVETENTCLSQQVAVATFPLVGADEPINPQFLPLGESQSPGNVRET